jgi:Zn-finger nucleic acid-binding protein
MSNTLICPKCGSEMRTYERNEVNVDQCTGCGGLFLDRGELERLVTAESAYYGAPAGGSPPPPQATAPPPRHHAPQHHAPPQNFDPRYGKKKNKKRSFLEELFE